MCVGDSVQTPTTFCDARYDHADTRPCRLVAAKHMSGERIASAEAKAVIDGLLSRSDLRLTLCNCPVCLPTHVPLEQRVLQQTFRHASVATRHWQDCDVVHEARICDEPCIPGGRQRYYTPSQAYDGLVERDSQLECAAIARASASTSNSSESSYGSNSSESSDSSDSSDSEGHDILFDDEYRSTVCTPSNFGWTLETSVV